MAYYEDKKGTKMGSRYKEGKRMDSGYMHMISEDHSAPANLPQHVKHTYYPPCGYMDRYELDDTIRGVDSQIRDSVHKLDEYASDSMY